MIFTLKDYLSLYRLGRVRNFSPENYFAFQEFQGGLLVRFLKNRKVLLVEQKTLDLGCGYGGYSAALLREGVHAVALDLNPISLVHALNVLGNALQVPFASEEFDLVICASLIEHVEKPGALLGEIFRILKKNGIAYLSFPPFYSPMGGHQFSPYHLFGESFAVRIAELRGGWLGDDDLDKSRTARRPAYRQAFGNWGLYKLTIAQAQKEILRLPFEIIERSTRWTSIDFSAIPILGEFLTWHVQYLLRK